MDINTGDLVKRLRKESHSPMANKIALAIAKNFGKTEAIAKFGIKLGIGINKTLNSNTLRFLTSSIRSLHVPFPIWLNSLSNTSKSSNYSQLESNSKVVYFPTCIDRMMGGNKKHINLTNTFISVCQKSEIQVLIENNSGLCCGQSFSSKGYSDAAAYAASQLIGSLWIQTKQGKYPVVMDTTSCAYTITKASPLLNSEDQAKLKMLKILDVTEFVSDTILPKIKIVNKKKSIALHPVCSLEKMKLKAKLVEVAMACADEVLVPQHAGCCGMAGDRGFFFPELTNAATKLEADEIKASTCEGHYSTGRTCEIALSEATGKEYVSLLYLLDEVSE